MSLHTGHGRNSRGPPSAASSAPASADPSGGSEADPQDAGAHRGGKAEARSSEYKVGFRDGFGAAVEALQRRFEEMEAEKEKEREKEVT